MDRKWKWSEDIYDDIFRTFVAFSNAHIRAASLRSSDVVRYGQSRIRILNIVKLFAVVGQQELLATMNEESFV